MMSGKMRSGARYSPRSPSAMAGQKAMEVRTAFTPHKEPDPQPPGIGHYVLTFRRMDRHTLVSLINVGVR